MSTGYDYGSPDLAQLLIARSFPEFADRESRVIHAWLGDVGRLYDRWSFSVRVGQGATPDPSHLPGVQANTVRASKKRIDVVAWRGDQATIVEVKFRLSPGALGQLLTYRHLWLEDTPNARDPQLVAIACYGDPDTIRPLTAAGVEVRLYPEADPAGGAAASGLPPGNGATAQ